MFVLALDIDFGTWAILAFAAVSVLGGLLKKKADSEHGPVAARRQPGEAPRPTTPERHGPGVGAPRPPRTPTPARPPRTTEVMPAEPVSAPALPGARPRPVPPARAPASPTRIPAIARRVEEVTPPQRRRAEARPRETRPPERAPGLRALEERGLVQIKGIAGGPELVERRRAAGPAERLNRVLQSRSGLQAAVLLSEILAPPLALRDNP
jgi:hypothetical protein